MDILIVSDFIKEYSSEREAETAMAIVNNFIEKRIDYYDYYVIFLNSSGEKRLSNDDFYTVDVKSDGAGYYQIFDNIFLRPLPHISISQRYGADPFGLTNPPIKMIFDSVKDYLNKNDRKIEKVYILPSSGCRELNILKDSFTRYVDKDSIYIIDLSAIHGCNEKENE